MSYVYLTPEGYRFCIRDRKLVWLDNLPPSKDQPTPAEITDMLFGWYCAQNQLVLPAGEAGDQQLAAAFADLLGGTPENPDIDAA